MSRLLVFWYIIIVLVSYNHPFPRSKVNRLHGVADYPAICMLCSLFDSSKTFFFIIFFENDNSSVSPQSYALLVVLTSSSNAQYSLPHHLYTLFCESYDECPLLIELLEFWKLSDSRFTLAIGLKMTELTSDASSSSIKSSCWAWPVL